jgi:hypothetical protein
MGVSLFFDVTFTAQDRSFTPVEMTVSAQVVIGRFQGHGVVRRRFKTVTVRAVKIFTAFIRDQFTVFIYMMTDTAVIIQKKNMVVMGEHRSGTSG